MTRRVVPAAALALAGLLLWWWWPTEQSRIRARIERLAAAVAGSDDESDLERMARVASIASGLTPDVSVRAAGRSLNGRDAVLTAARGVAATRRALDVDIEEAEITLAQDDTHARARVVARVDDGFHELSVSLRREHGIWLVEAIWAEAPLRRPGAGAPS